jgi:hypothetical protein
MDRPSLVPSPDFKQSRFQTVQISVVQLLEKLDPESPRVSERQAESGEGAKVEARVSLDSDCADAGCAGDGGPCVGAPNHW